MRSVLVTGGSRGLGLAIASTLATAGYRVIAIARTESDELRRVLTAAGESTQRGALHFRAFDFNRTGEIAGFVASVREEFGPLYGLVNNAAVGTAGVLAMMRDDQIEQLTRLNILSPIILSKYVLRSMMVERAGRIINISSILAATGYHGLSTYAATKAALVGFTRSLAREVGPLGITVNAIAPGFLSTRMTQDLAPADRERIVRRSAMRRLVDVNDVAAGVEFLMSDGARNITGITLTVDAGSTA